MKGSEKVLLLAMAIITEKSGLINNRELALRTISKLKSVGGRLWGLDICGAYLFTPPII